VSTGSSDPYHLDKQRLAAAFDRAAARYEDRAVLQNIVAERMDERLDFVKLEPDWILDGGAGTGFATRLLTKRYREARVLALDLSHNMLLEARRRASQPWSREYYLRGDLESLSIASASVDMVFSNLALQWCNDLDRAFRECLRVLKPNGLFMFSTFGPDTLKELRASWAALDDKTHVHAFFDMHDIGDALIRAGFSGPVLDVEHLTLTYPDVHAVMRDLKDIGAVNVALGRRRGLTGKRHLTAVREQYEQYRREGVLPATYEVVYGHAWAPEPHTRPQDGSTVSAFPISKLTRLKRPMP
jgi:malonyl-CoA O-methyltransferase